MPLAAGTRLGVFEIRAPLGKGGMGEVYRAKDTKLDEAVTNSNLIDSDYSVTSCPRSPSR